MKGFAILKGHPKLAVLACLAAIGALVGTVAQADYVQHGKLLVYFDAGIKPKALPRDELRPVKVGFIGSFENLDGSDVPALKTMTLQLAKGGVVQSTGLARCSKARLVQQTTESAIAECRDALVGSGEVSTAVRFPDGRRLRAKSKLLLFNSSRDILMHIYTTEPLEGTFIIPLHIHKSRGPFGTVLSARVPRLAAGYGYLTGFRMTMSRLYRYRGQKRSYLLASCAAPKGLNRVAFELARVDFRFAGGVKVSNSSLNVCRVAG
jgi:hypothetical protein